MEITIILMLIVAYFALYRPYKERKKIAEMRSSVEVGDVVTLIGGEVGKVICIDNDTMTIETGEEKVRIQVTKWSVRSKTDVSEKGESD